MSLLNENVFINASHGSALTDAGNFLIYPLITPFSSDVDLPKPKISPSLNSANEKLGIIPVILN